MIQYRRLLVISHNCFSRTGSNGRTLSNYLQGWPKDKLAQFYLHAENPDFAICNQYYCMTDSSIVKSILNRKSAGYIVKNTSIANDEFNTSVTPKKERMKNSIAFGLREAAWNSRFWNSSGFDNWLNKFSPEVVLVQAGDLGFLFNLAVSISKKFNATIVVYNTEGYYFKKQSYLSENCVSKFFFSMLNRRFKKSYDRLVKESKAQIYNCNLLRDDYEKVFHTGSHVIMNTSELSDEDVFSPKKNQIIYAGNLGLFRHKSLIEFANALQRVNPDIYVDVYGKAPDEESKQELELCVGIRMHGFIPYEELKQKLRESKYLVHIESFDSFYREDLKYAFSTKIADSLAVGACLFVYAPENMAVCRYLKDKNAAALITEPDSLEQRIEAVLQNESLCRIYAENGRKLAEENHNLRMNREEFQKILLT